MKARAKARYKCGRAEARPHLSLLAEGPHSARVRAPGPLAQPTATCRRPEGAGLRRAIATPYVAGQRRHQPHHRAGRRLPRRRFGDAAPHGERGHRPTLTRRHHAPPSPRIARGPVALEIVEHGAPRCEDFLAEALPSKRPASSCPPPRRQRPGHDRTLRWHSGCRVHHGAADRRPAAVRSSAARASAGSSLALDLRRKNSDRATTPTLDRALLVSNEAFRARGGTTTPGLGRAFRVSNEARRLTGRRRPGRFTT